MSARSVLAVALLLLSALYAYWAGRDGNAAAALVFAIPPLLLALASYWKPRGAAFWSGVLALAWFSHGVMVAWSHPQQRGFALTGIFLSLMVILAANGPALRSRFTSKRTRP